MFRKGDEVIISLDKTDRTIPLGMYKYDGVETTITKPCKVKARNISMSVPTTYGFELKDVVSDFGVPYTFTADMLIPVGGEECI